MPSGIKEIILQTPLEGIGKDFIEKNFAAYYDREAKQQRPALYDANEIFELTKSEYPFLKEAKVTTTAGMLTFNRYTLEKTNIIQVLGYSSKITTDLFKPSRQVFSLRLGYLGII